MLNFLYINISDISVWGLSIKVLSNLSAAVHHCEVEIASAGSLQLSSKSLD